MLRATSLLASTVVLVGACGRIGFSSLTADASDPASDEGETCTLGPWGSGEWQEMLASADDDWEPAMSHDGLVLVFASDRNSTMNHLFVATRTSQTEPFGNVRPVTELTAGGVIRESSAAWSTDGLRLYFARDGRPMSAEHLGGGMFASPIDADLPLDTSSWVLANHDLEIFYMLSVGGADADLQHATRASPSDPWTTDGAVAGMNRVGLQEGWPAFDEARQELYIERDADPGHEIRVASRPSPEEPFGPLALLDIGGDVDTSRGDPDVSRDGRTLVFSAARPGGAGGYDIYVATRGCQ